MVAATSGTSIGLTLLIAFLQDEYPGALPKQRAELVDFDRMTARAAE